MSNTISDVLTLSRTLNQIDTNALSDATGIIFSNTAILDLRKKIIGKRQDLFNQESQRDITTNEIVGGSEPGKFLFPSDMYFLKSIEVNYQDSTQSDYYVPLEKIDASNLPQGVTLDWLRTNQPMSQPLYDIHGDWFEIFPTPVQTMTNALKINYFLQPTSFTATTDAINYPESLDYTILAYKVASIYLESIGKDNTQMENGYVRKVKELLEVLEGDSEQPTKAKGIPLTGWEF